MTYGTELQGLGGSKFAGHNEVEIGDSAFLWQDPSEIDATTPQGWYTDSDVQKVGLGLGSLALGGYLFWYLWKQSKKR